MADPEVAKFTDSYGTPHLVAICILLYSTMKKLPANEGATEALGDKGTVSVSA